MESTPLNTMDQDQDQEMDTLNNNVKTVRIWADGCYDLTHFGHANNLRQAKGRGDILVVGVHSDEEIEQNKGSRPVLTSEERYALVAGIKWVDQVVEAAPYVTNLETLDKHDCKCCAHGNDITTTADGRDTYEIVKSANRYIEVDRAQGVSTTDLVKRILKSGRSREMSTSTPEVTSGPVKSSPYSGTHFISTGRRLRQFSEAKDPSPGARVVYVDGTFDLFHPGHLAFLREAKKLGDYLYVGLYDDATATRTSDLHQTPIMNLQERVQNILGFKYVDDVVIGAPFTISHELLTHLNVAVVCHGVSSKVTMDPDTNEDPYQIPREAGILQEIDSGSLLTTGEIIGRVLAKRDQFEKRNKDKEAKELARIEAMRSED